ncbi:MAG: hypothetical protein ACK5EA_05145 [Planctomycetaceae bacterium]
MRKFILCTLLAATALINSGCIVPIFSSERDRRARQLIYPSENFRQILDIWERFWFLDQPDYETHYRNNGGVI